MIITKAAFIIAALITATAFAPTEAKTETPPKKTAKTEWTQETHRFRNSIVRLGVNKSLADHMIDGCKKKADDPRKCVKTAVAIYGNESSFGKRCKDNSCFGFVGFSFKSKEEAFDRWLKSYVKYWQKHD